jgi:leucyl/phenylalanyl-tRNA--protein transferase
MTIYHLFDEPVFPDPAEADPDGLLAVGGDLSPVRLIAAYASGIFPWYAENSPILWWSPDPRLVLEPSQLHVPRSLKRMLNANRHRFTLDTAFAQVICACARTPRPGQEGTWILPEIIEAYERLHSMGLAHSAEVWNGEQLVGGLYGVALGSVFFGESMFFVEPNASKAAFVLLVRWLADRGCTLIDCEQTTAHLLRFGGREMSRPEFLRRVREGVQHPALAGSPWQMDGRRG